MKKKLLSIITVTKNCASTIERTLNSVELVKSDQVEYIVVDGMSDDGTLEIIKKYSKVIDVFVYESDTGIYTAMNKGVLKAHGEFVLFINGDDEIIPHGLKQVLAMLPFCKESIICATTEVVGDQINPSFSYIPNPSRLTYWSSIPHPSSFIRRDLLIETPYREDLKIASDYDFFLKSFLSGKSFKIAPYQSALYYYGGISSNTKKTRFETDIILRDNLGWSRAYLNKIILNLWREIRKIINWFRIKK